MNGTAETTSRTAAISEVAEMSEEALLFVHPQMHPLEYVHLLTDKKLFPDAVRFLAHALPKREAVWWGWMCARRAHGDNAPPKIKTCLAATEKWIAQPTDENRREAMEAAEIADFGTPAGCAGLGAFFSGDSLAPPGAPAVPPGEYLTAKAISGAVIFAAMGGEPEEAPEKFRTFIGQAIDVSKRIKLWEGKQV
jgi:hypothetical protein